MIRSSIDIARVPEEVFAYLADLERHREWQEDVVSERTEPEGPTRVGTRAIQVRRIPGGPREFVSEVVEYDPPRRVSARSVGSPLASRVSLAVEPVDGHSRVTLEFELQGRGFWSLLARFVRSRSARQIPKDLAALKRVLETRPTE